MGIDCREQKDAWGVVGEKDIWSKLSERWLDDLHKQRIVPAVQELKTILTLRKVGRPTLVRSCGKNGGEQSA